MRFRDHPSPDMPVVFDGPSHNSGRPTLTFGARGITRIALTTFDPRAAQHSGRWGNRAPNPACVWQYPRLIRFDYNISYWLSTRSRPAGSSAPASGCSAGNRS